MSGFVSLGGGGIIGGGNSDVIAVSTSGSRPVKGSKAGASWFDLGSNFAQNLGSPGGGFGETVKVGSEAFIVNTSGELYKTTNFRAFTRINIVSIPSGNAPNFPGQAYLFKDPSYPNRLYASARGNGNNWTKVWYSDDLGLNWTDCGFQTAGSTVNIKNWVIIGNYFYCGISVVGNSGVKLYRFNRFNFSDNGQVSNTSLPSQCWSHVIGSRLFALNGSLVWTDNPLSGGNNVTFPSSFSGSCMTQRSIGGAQRQVIIGINGSNLAIAYSNNAPESTWTLATVPTIVLGGVSVGYMKVIPLSKQEGFVASYIDTSDNTPSGILYSADGITWTEADAGNLTNYLNVMNNPLVG
jgi:hypothetical protein